MTVYQPSPLMLPYEVAAAFGVTPRQVATWARAGKLSAIQPNGGARRFLRAEVDALVRGEPLTPQQVEAEWKRLRGGAS